MKINFPLSFDNGRISMTMRRLHLMGVMMLLFMFVTISHVMANDQNVHDFEVRAYEIRTDLIHNRTYDMTNVRIADSLYAKSEELGSTLGKLYALHIKYYALVGNDKVEEFYKAVDEFIAIALDNEYYEEYFDAMSAKTQFLMGHHEYAKCMDQAKDMLKTAQKAHNQSGLYESNMLIGQIYKHMDAWLIAESYLKKALDAVRKIEFQDSIPYCLLYRELAECNVGSRNYDKALEYAVKAKQMAPFDTYRYFCEWTYLSVLYSSGDHKGFREAYAQSELRDKDVTSNMDANMIRSLEIMVLVANRRFSEAVAKAKEFDAMSGMYGQLSAIYRHAGNYRLAYEYLQKEQALTDSIEMNLLQGELAELEVRLGTTTLKYEAEQATARMRLIVVISMASIFTIVIGFLIYSLRLRRKRNRQLLAANRSIEQKNAQLIEAKEKTEKALVAAEKANAMRIHFIENMTHEIRTPLNAISGFAQVLTSGGIAPDSDEAREINDIIMQNTVNLTQMLDNIIEISSYDSSTANVHLSDVTVRSIIEEGMKNIPQSSCSEGVTLSIAESEACDAMLSTDPVLASKALFQIYSNAVKFTKEGSITVSAEKDDEHIRIIVTDTGIGVSDDLHEKVFERFYKVDEFVPGAGLGLSLCRAIMSTLGGSVALDTAYSDGCRFVLTLPAVTR